MNHRFCYFVDETVFGFRNRSDALPLLDIDEGFLLKEGVGSLIFRSSIFRVSF